MIPTGFPMRLPPCLQFRPGCQQVAFTRTLLNTRVEHHVLDSSNRDSDHKKVMLPSRTSFSGRANAEPHIVIGRARSMLLFRGKPLGNFQPYGYCAAAAFRSIDWINHFSIIRQHGYWPTHGIGTNFENNSGETYEYWSYEFKYLNRENSTFLKISKHCGKDKFSLFCPSNKKIPKVVRFTVKEKKV